MAFEEVCVDVEEVAAHLKVTKEFLYRWVGSKGFPAHRVGRLVQLKPSEVGGWVTTSGSDDFAPPALVKTPEARLADRKANVKKKNRHG